MGQRNTLQRVNLFRKHVDFKNKTVVDFGCNVGAVLHHLEEIHLGIGLDFDKNCVDAGNRISGFLGKDNIGLIHCDLDKETLESISEKLPENIDVALLLSIGSWVKNWKTIYKLAAENSSEFIIELNNKEEGEAQIAYLQQIGCTLLKIADQSLDDNTGNYKRILYLGFKPLGN